MFAAYGVTPNGDDPLSHAFHGLIDNSATQEHQIARIIALLNKSGIACEGLPELEKFDPDQLNKLVE